MRLGIGALAASTVVLVLSAASAVASSDDYSFEVAGPIEHVAGGYALTVRLVHLPENHFIADADVFQRKIEFRHKSIPAIDERRVQLQSDGKGQYRLISRYELTPGTSIKLAARVPGQSASIRGSVQVPR